jgi:pimeloyl-ACP methyl ester carboxylesterase
VTSVPRAAKWWAQDYLYAGWWQLKAALSRAKPEDFASGTGRAVVVIPGIYESWQFMLPLIEALHRNGHPVHVVTLLQRNRLPVQQAAQLVADYVTRQDLHEAVLVAHSKGGLIGKYAMLKLDQETRISRMVAICSPFSGSRYARFLLVPSLRAFSPRDALTLQLAKEEDVNQRITSIFGEFDPHIPEGSLLPEARNIKLDLGGHFRILSDPRTIQAVVAEAV